MRHALLLLYYYFTTSLLLPYYRLTTAFSPDLITYNTLLDVLAKSAHRRGHAAFLQGLQVKHALLLLYNCFTTALQLLYYCLTTATTALLLCLHRSRVLRLQVLELMSTARVAPDLISYNSLLNIASKGAAAPGNKDWSANGLRVYIYKP